MRKERQKFKKKEPPKNYSAFSIFNILNLLGGGHTNPKLKKGETKY